jgi:type I restriction enzyme R subunit
MSIAVKNPRYESDMLPYKEKRVIFIVDECHRSQFGDMHKDIRKHFNNAQYFGFTGTPIFEDNANKGRATGDLFGKQVHTYMIKDGIRDHNVLGFKVDYIKTFSLASNVPDEDVEDINTKNIHKISSILGLKRLKFICYDNSSNTLHQTVTIDVILTLIKKISRQKKIETILF